MKISRAGFVCFVDDGGDGVCGLRLAVTAGKTGFVVQGFYDLMHPVPLASKVYCACKD